MIPFYFSIFYGQCRDTNLWRPNNDVGLARRKSLTIRFVESGLERLAFGHRALVQTGS